MELEFEAGEFEDVVNFAAENGRLELARLARRAPPSFTDRDNAIAVDPTLSFAEKVANKNVEDEREANQRMEEVENAELPDMAWTRFSEMKALLDRVCEFGKTQSMLSTSKEHGGAVAFSQLKFMFLRCCIGDVIQQWLFHAHGAMSGAEPFRRVDCDRVFLVFEQAGQEASTKFVYTVLTKRSAASLWMPDAAQAAMLAQRIIQEIVAFSSHRLREKRNLVDGAGRGLQPCTDLQLKMKIEVELEFDQTDEVTKELVNLSYGDRDDAKGTRTMCVFKPHFEMLLDAYKTHGGDPHNQKRLLRIFVMLARYVLSLLCCALLLFQRLSPVSRRLLLCFPPRGSKPVRTSS